MGPLRPRSFEWVAKAAEAVGCGLVHGFMLAEAREAVVRVRLEAVTDTSYCEELGGYQS